jgi:hypothetical protein
MWNTRAFHFGFHGRKISTKAGGSGSMASTTRRRLAVLEPTGEVFVNGLASSYEDEFPQYADSSVASHMTPDEFHAAITKINDALQDHWPCLPCTSFAYGCCVCTLGLSFYCASAQVREAESRVQLQIRRINDQKNFRARQIEWKLVRVWHKRSSFIEISVASDAPLPDLPEPTSAGDATMSVPATEAMEGRTAL